MAEKLIGKVTHFYDKIGVGVIELSSALKVGDKIKVKKGGEEFEQIVDSMQVEHKGIKAAKKGDDVGMKLAQAVRPVAEVYLVK
ncbi:MAG: hypothetical protein ABH854_05845 [Candidatus Diapherotrites archaeon]|nr:hypothetical protein [Candidatus Micrarchaeota archaeon]MBU1939452.1 hypothetical protein [Candidatus Micrarchaeota archaeon]